MSRQANKTAIGIFVVGAIALCIVAVLVLGSGNVLKQRFKYVMFFDESVKGLSVGAPVGFRGVQVGRVTDVFIHADLDEMSLSIPVIIEFDDKKVKSIGDRDPDKNVRLLIDQGLKAQLQMQSVVTGQLMIGLALHPDKPIKMKGGYEGLPEIPTIPTTLEQISKSLEDFPIRETLDKFQSVIEGFDEFINSPELAETVLSLKNVAENTEGLIRTMKEEIEPVSNSVQETMEQYEKLAENIDQHVEPLSDDINETLEEIRGGVLEAERTLIEVKGLVAEDSITATELRKTLRELSGAARAIRAWVDYLERHPEAMIWGKGENGR